MEKSDNTIRNIVGCDFPKETIDLPSKGWFYSPDHVLSSGKVDIKYMTSREEDILTSVNLLKKGIVIDKLLESVVVGVPNIGDLLLGDKNAIMVASRILGYGKDYKATITCPVCANKQTEMIDLTGLDHKEIKFDQFPKGINKFSFKLPSSKVDIEFKLLTGNDEKAIDTEIKSLAVLSKKSGIDSEISTRLKRMIISINGEDDRQKINNFINTGKMLSIDSLALRKHMQNIIPDVNLEFLFECFKCDASEIVPIPISTEFFWPAGRR